MEKRVGTPQTRGQPHSASVGDLAELGTLKM